MGLEQARGQSKLRYREEQNLGALMSSGAPVAEMLQPLRLIPPIVVIVCHSSKCRPDLGRYGSKRQLGACVPSEPSGISRSVNARRKGGPISRNLPAKVERAISKFLGSDSSTWRKWSRPPASSATIGLRASEDAQQFAVQWILSWSASWSLARKLHVMMELRRLAC